MHDVLTDAEVADLLGCEASTINERAASGDLPAVKFGRSWRFPREALLKVLNEKALARTTFQPLHKAMTARDDPLALDIQDLFLVRHEFDATPCVYFLFRQSELVYVGKTINLPRRLFEHTKDKQFDSYSALACLPEELGPIEEHYIRKFKPRWNNVLFATVRVNPACEPA